MSTGVSRLGRGYRCQRMHRCVPRVEELHESSTIKFETGANGVDVVLRDSGSPSAYNDAFSIVRNGGTVLLFGITRKPLLEFDIANAVIWKGVTGQRNIFGRKMFETWETMLRLLQSERFDTADNLSRIIGAKGYALDEYETAFERLVSGAEMKLVFEPQL